MSTSPSVRNKRLSLPDALAINLLAGECRLHSPEGGIRYPNVLLTSLHMAALVLILAVWLFIFGPTL